MTSPDCVFCQIVAREADASIVFESDSVLAFMDINPVTAGHLLVIPKAHLPELADLTDDLAAQMLSTARSLAAAPRRSPIPCEGINLFYADGEAAGQEVFHSHLHVFPRTAGDGFVISARWGQPDRPDLNAHAQAIKAAL